MHEEGGGVCERGGRGVCVGGRSVGKKTRKKEEESEMKG